MPDHHHDADHHVDERYVPGTSGAHYEHEHRYLLARSLAHGTRAVDLASGAGYGAAWLADEAEHVVGVEISESAVTAAAHEYRQVANLSFVRGDITRAPVASQSADLVTCFEAIEHVPEPKDVAAEIARILKPGGLALISTPDKAAYSGELEIDNPYHPSELYLDEFEDLLVANFSSVLLLGQRTVSGSCVWPIASGDHAPGGRLRVTESLATPTVAKPSLTHVYVIAVCSHRTDDPRLRAVANVELFSDDELQLAGASDLDELLEQRARLQRLVAAESVRSGRAAQQLLELRPLLTRLLRELAHQRDAIARLQDRPLPEPQPPAQREHVRRARTVMQRARRLFGRGRTPPST